jgi:1,5-anhydro-D-fructose reductase (1,5-anhydro-D-mannitol-forming)
MSGSGRLGWGIVGAGDIANRVTAPAMKAARGNELVAVLRRTRAGAEEFAARHGARRAYDRLEDLLADPEVGAVYIATPVARHHPETLAAAAAGKHVLCEKPLALDAAEGIEMRDACARAGVLLGTCFYQRFNARHAKIRALLNEEAVGRVTAVRMNFSGRLPDRPDAWRQVPEESGGGPYMDCGSHCADLLRFFFGEIVEVAAFADTLVARHRVEDTATSLLRLRGGAHAVVSCHWTTGDPDESRGSMIEVHGTEGVIISFPLHEKFSRGTLRLVTGSRDESWSFEASTHVAMLEDFAAAVAERRPPAITGDDGIASLRVVEAAYESSRTRRAVALEPR